MERRERTRWTVLLTLSTISLVTFCGATSASATVLCQTASNPCTGGTYGEGTQIELALPSESFSVIKTALLETYCEEVTIKGEVTTPGGAGTDVSGPVTELAFGKCTENCSIPTMANGNFSIAYTGAHDGTLTLKGFEFHTWCPLCIFNGPVSMPLSGGEMASGSLNATLTKKQGFLCDYEGNTWTASFTVTAPEPLYIEES